MAWDDSPLGPCDECRATGRKGEAQVSTFEDTPRNRHTIRDLVAEFYLCSITSLLGPSRCTVFVRTRWIAWMLTQKYLGTSLVDLGRMYNRDHTTIMHGIRRARELIALGDTRFLDLGMLQKRIRAALDKGQDE